MKYQDASITATFNDQTETVDLEQVGNEDGMWDHLITVFIPDSEDNGNNRDEVQAGTTFTDPQGFAVHLFRPIKNEDFEGLGTVANFDELLEAWSDESDDDRREAMGEYLDDMGADDLSDFDEAYRGAICRWCRVRTGNGRTAWYRSHGKYVDLYRLGTHVGK